MSGGVEGRNENHPNRHTSYETLRCWWWWRLTQNNTHVDVDVMKKVQLITQSIVICKRTAHNNTTNAGSSFLSRSRRQANSSSGQTV